MIDNCNYVIRYENIAEDYIAALKKAGIKNPRKLPFANKTSGKKEDTLEYFTDDIKGLAIFVFGPFLEKYNYSFPASWGKVKLSIKSRVQFKTLGFFRRINQKYFKNHPRSVGSQGTIYGNIKRNERKA